MQKKILSMILAIAMVISMFAGIAVTASAAEPVTLSFAGGDAKNHDTLNFADEASGITAVFDKNNHSTAPRHDATCVRFYGTTSVTNTLTVSAPAGYDVTAIAFAMNGTYDLAKVSADSGAIEGTNWTGSANAVVFTTTAQTRIEGITVTYEASGACTHANTTSESTNPPSCLEDGAVTVTCSDCGESWTESIAALGHEWTEETITPATCTEDGLVKATCSRCGATEERVVTATGHDFSNGDCPCGEPAPAAEVYTIVTDASELADGDKIIIASAAPNEKSGLYYALPAYVSGNNIKVVPVTPVEGTITLAADAGFVPYVLGATETGWTLFDGALYLYAPSASSNYLKGEKTPGTNAYWNITITDGVAAIINVNNTGRSVMALNYNNGTPMISCYAAQGTYDTLAIYKLGGEAPPAACEHAADAYTCNEDGTHSFTCTLCGETVTADCDATVAEEIPATCNAYGTTSYECAVCAGEWTVTGTEYGEHAWDGASCTVCGATRNIYTKVEDVTALADGAGIVIYYAGASKLLSGEASSNRLLGVNAVAADGIVYANEGGELFLIVRIDENGDYYFETEDGKYLTSGATGNSLTLEASLTDYAKWYFDTTGTVAALRIANRNATYNGGIQALEYYAKYDAFTVYGIKDEAIYAFEIYQRDGFSAHTHAWGEGEVTTPASCTEDGVMTATCASCGETQTSVIPATGHDFTAGDICAICEKPVIKGQKADIVDGDTIIIYNAAANMTLTNTADGYYLAGSAAVACGEFVITAAPEVTIWTVEVVDAEANTFRFKTADGIYLQTNDKFSFTNSATLAAEGETDYSVWQVSDGKYLKSVATGKAIEYYGGKWTTYGLSTTNTAFDLSFFKTNTDAVCEHNYEETVIATPDCTTDGESTFTCSICGDSYTTTVPATGHNYVLVEEIAPDCVNEGINSFECDICGDSYDDPIPATGHADNDLDGACDACGEPVEADIWELSTTAPAAGNKYVIVAKDAESGKYYALTTADVNASTSAGVEVIVVNNKMVNPTAEMIFGAREHTYFKEESEWTGIGFYEPNKGNCLHLNSSKIRVTSSAQNGVFSFAAGTAENTFTMLGDVNTRYLTFSGTNFGVSAEAGTDLYFFYKVCDHDATYVSGAKEATCTEPGSTGTTKCVWCAAEVVAAEEIPALGHNYDSSNPVETVESTCTEDGAYTYVCTVCGGNVVEVIPASGHNEAFVDNGDGTHRSECCVCLAPMSENAPHTFVDGVCVCGAVEVVEPTLDSSLTFGAQLYLENDLTMAFRVKSSKLANYDASTAYLVVERDVYASGAAEATVETMIISDYTINGDRMVFSYPGISAAQMNDAIRATLYVKDASGKEYVGPVYNTSIAFYLDGLLKASAADTKLVTLIMDMVNYGAAAQVYFDRHADALVNEAYDSFKTYASYASADFTTALENMATTEGSDGKPGKLNIGLDLGTRIGAQYKVTIPAGVNVEDISLVVTDAEGNVLETMAVAGNPTDSKGRYLVNFYGFTSRDMRRVVYATAYVNGEAITGTYGYSISTYAWGIQTNAASQPENLVNVTRAMMLYGDSAAAYFAG